MAGQADRENVQETGVPALAVTQHSQVRNE